MAVIRSQTTMRYTHTQRAPFLYVLLALAAAAVIGAWLSRNDAAAMPVALGVGVVLVVVAFSFGEMTVQDEGSHLAIRYGPLPMFRKRIPYAAITAAEAGRTSLIDGWGIHYVPGRGWTYNLWGFACVKVRLGKKIIRIGSDDVDHLTNYLSGRMPRAE